MAGWLYSISFLFSPLYVYRGRLAVAFSFLSAGIEPLDFDRLAINYMAQNLNMDPPYAHAKRKLTAQL